MARPKKLIQKFSDVKVPKTEHAKEVARQAAKRKQKSEESPSFASVVDGKVIKYTVKPRGVYSTYLGNVKKLGSEKFTLLKKRMESKSQWVESHMVEAKIHEVKGTLPEPIVQDESDEIAEHAYGELE